MILSKQELKNLLIIFLGLRNPTCKKKHPFPLNTTMTLWNEPIIVGSLK